ncbi:hypothetical protein T07_13661 [Trichinella nelsoni]|uniref:Uncharacterized protein n=1 Tax=Trichinella nelsoni TaxID=6336 RepID=A0A0V0S1B1_9BILA|nr:hypothetical protein T07_13661 [Trichinella nelsoni]
MSGGRFVSARMILKKPITINDQWHFDCEITVHSADAYVRTLTFRLHRQSDQPYLKRAQENK